MGAKRALTLLQTLHDRGDRNNRRVAGEDRIRPHVVFDFGKQLLLERQILQYGFDDIIGVAHRGCQIGDRCHPLDCFGIVAEIIQVREDARLGAVEACLGLIRDGDIVPGQRKILRDAVAHQAGADHRDFCLSHSALSVHVPDAVQHEVVHR